MYVIADGLGLEGGDPPLPLQRPAAEVTARVEDALNGLAALRTRASLSFEISRAPSARAPPARRRG